MRVDLGFAFWPCWSAAVTLLTLVGLTRVVTAQATPPVASADEARSSLSRDPERQPERAPRSLPRARGGVGLSFASSMNGHGDFTGGFALDGHIGVQWTRYVAFEVVTRGGAVLTNEPAFILATGTWTFEVDGMVEWVLTPTVQLGAGVGASMVDGRSSQMPRALLFPLHLGLGPSSVREPSRPRHGWQWRVDVAPGVTEPYAHRPACFFCTNPSYGPVLPPTLVVSVSVGLVSYDWL